MAIRLHEAFVVETDRERAWRFVADPAGVVACIPSAEVVDRGEDGTVQAEVGFGMGPFGARMPARFRLEAADVGRRTVRIVGEVGSDGAGLGARLEMKIELEPAGEATTRVRVRHTVELGGRMAPLEESAVARNMADMLFGRFVRELREGVVSSRP